MEYKHTITGIFLERPNRFIAICLINGIHESCHVKNTGRCRELLVPGASVILEPAKKQDRKTKYTLIAVYKGNQLVNLDSQAPNQLVFDWIQQGHLFSDLSLLKREVTFASSRFDLYAESSENKAFIEAPNQLVFDWIQQGHLFSDLSLLKREVTFASSRFDLYAESSENKAFIEIKGCTLEENGVALFPDAPTTRGIKHILELEKCVQYGFQAFLFFVIQMSSVQIFRPNYRSHPDFAKALLHASQHGVHILAYDCSILPPTRSKQSLNITIKDPVPIDLLQNI